MKKTGYKHITTDDFVRIKLMLNKKLSVNEVNQITGRDKSTLYRIARSTTFDEYRGALTQRRLKRPAVQTALPVEQAAQSVEDSYAQLLKSMDEFNVQLRVLQATVSTLVRDMNLRVSALEKSIAALGTPTRSRVTFWNRPPKDDN